MLKIGEFSKLSQLSIKTLRYYEKEKILLPSYIDKNTSYRFYETSKLLDASLIKSFRQLDFSIKDIKKILNSNDLSNELLKKVQELEKEKQHIESSLSIIKHLLKENTMKYQVIEKEIKECIVYTSETVLKEYNEIMSWIPSLGEKCLKLNPNLKCANPQYEFCVFLDGEYKEKNVHIKHYEAVSEMGIESDEIKFETLPKTKVLSIYHKGAYRNLPEAYAYILDYAKKNNYIIKDFPRECYIDGIWNKEKEEDWLTEIQLPIE